MHAGTIRIRVAAPPVENAANRALIDFVAEQLGVAKGRVRIVSGSTGRRKVLEVEGLASDVVANKLSATVKPG
jgi:uncharacterized protein